METVPLLAAESLHKTYFTGEARVTALAGVSFTSRLDVLLPAGADLQRSLDVIAARLLEGLSAQRPARRGEQVETMLAAFHANLTALSWIALIVGLFSSTTP